MKSFQSLTRKQLILIYAVMLALGLITLGIQQGTAQSINVKSDMSNAVQSIGEIVFASGGIKDPDPRREVRVKSINGVLTFDGNVLVGNAGDLETDPGAQVTLVGGQKGLIQGAKKSAIAGGKLNSISNAENTAVIGGENLEILSGSKNSTIAGGKENNLQGNWLVILGWSENQLKGSNSAIAGGDLITLSGDHSFAAGKNIKVTADNAFVWWDSLLRRPSDPLRMFSPTEKTFAIRAKNGIGVNTNNPQVEGMEVNGLIQIGYHGEACTADNQGAIMYLDSAKIGGKGGCFCECGKEGSNPQWRLLSRKDNCKAQCANAR